MAATAYAVQATATALGLGPSAPKPDTTTTTVKLPRPPRISGYGISRLYGAIILYETAYDGTAIDVHAVHDGEIDQIVQRYLGDDAITLTGNVVNEGTDGRYKDGAISFYETMGVSPGTPFAAVIAALPTIWTSDHRGDGVALIALLSSPVKSKNFLDVYPNNIPSPSIAAQWQKCPDPYAEDPTDESGWTWTYNPIRQLMHYKLVREGEDFATKFAPTIAFWQAAADICEEAVDLKAGGTEDRYRSSVAHKHTDAHAQVVAGLLSTCDGWIAPRSDGALIVYAGKYYEPTVSIGPEHIVAYDWQGVGVDDDQAVNEIICSYISADHDYNTVECDAWRDEEDIVDRGQVLSDSLDPQVPSWGQVRRLAKRKMSRVNALYRGTVTTNVAGRIVRGQRFINLDLTEAGTTFYSGPAEITAVTRNMATGGVTFTWAAADPNIDAWNAATEEGEPAAKGDRVALEPLEAPEITSASPALTGDGLSAQILVAIAAPDRPDLTWYARWKKSTDAIWNEASYSDIDASTSVELLVGLVPVDSMVNVQASFGTGGGQISPWSATVTVDTTYIT
ncbi:hypothetical protein ASD39_20185 [Sphingomonas sp. Root50]|nr:hypothetical protein ASD17_14790 [Sphingomonas sp. Root1294]KQY72249.1 hypothetical protein ASD39_20185 [Sphingomonas sp. Root50]KRB94480.1 hypothetical protein ASE22_00565 [Sphingomonas sp. Root720]